jgi:hypothetical protein
MAENDLFPGYVAVRYHSQFGNHLQILPTRAWSSTAITGALGSWEGWNAVPIDGEVMVNALIDKFAALFPPDVAYESATVYTIDAPGAGAIPRKAVPLIQVGTLGSSTLTSAAFQANWMFRDDEYALSKLVFLDITPGANFFPVTDTTGITAVNDVIAQWTDIGNAWSTRNGLRPTIFQKITYTLNEKLRKEYGMT